MSIVCYEKVCPEGTALDTDGRTCVSTCERLRYFDGEETHCREDCPPAAPFRSSGWCLSRCPPGTFLIPGSLSCASPDIPRQKWLRLSGLPGVRFLRRTAPSYARMDVLVGESGRFAAFLETPSAVASLRLRVRVAVPEASWAGALLWTGRLCGAELQLSGEGGLLLAERLGGDVQVSGCLLFASVRGRAALVAEAGKHRLELSGCREDLGGEEDVLDGSGLES